MNTAQPLDRVAAQLEELRSERNTIASTRTKEDVRSLAENWLAAALGQVNGSTNYVLNGHIDQASVQSVLAEFLLESDALVSSIIAKVEAAATMTNRQRDAKLKKLDAEIERLQQEQMRHARAAALAAVEERFGGVAE